MKDQDISAIQDVNSKKHNYLVVVGTGPNQHLEVKQVSWGGRVLMCLSGILGINLHNAAMKKVITYLGNNLQEPLSINLKKKVFSKIDSYCAHHKRFNLDDKISKFFKTLPSNCLLEKDGYILGLSLSPRRDLSDYLQTVTYKQWKQDKTVVRTKGPNTIDDVKYDEIEAVIEERIKALDDEFDFSQKLKDSKKEDLYSLHQVMEPLKNSTLSISLLSEDEIKNFDINSVVNLSDLEMFALKAKFDSLDLKDSAMKKNLNALALNDLSKLQKILTKMPSLTKLLDDETVKKIIKDKNFTFILADLIFDTDERIALITPENVNLVIQKMTYKHFDKLSQEATEAVTFANILNFIPGTFDDFYKAKPNLMQKLTKAELDQALTRFLASTAFRHISDDQLKKVDLKCVGTYDQLFGPNPDKKRFQLLSGDQITVANFVILLKDKYYDILSEEQLKAVAGNSNYLSKDKFDKIFKKKS